jgi:hypothetical protein
MEDFDPGIPEFEFLPILQGMEFEFDLRRFMEAVRRPGFLRQSDSAGTVIGMDMGIDDMGDFHALGRGERQICIYVLFMGIDHGAFSFASASEEIGSAAGFVVVVWSK